MKYFNLEMLENFSWKEATTPKPFAGKWPTRLYYRGADRSYFGKPHPSAIRNRERAVTFDPTSCIVEFDRGGVVYHWFIYSGVMTVGPLFKFYHFWQLAAPGASHILDPTYSKRVGGWNIYSPYKTLKLAYIDQWKEFAADLAKVKRRAKVIKPAEAKAKPAHNPRANFGRLIGQPDVAPIVVPRAQGEGRVGPVAPAIRDLAEVYQRYIEARDPHPQEPVR